MTDITTDMSPQTTRHLRLAGWLAAAGLVALPAIAMQFTPEVDWSPGDFLFAAVAFAIVGGLLELAARASGNVAFRIGAAIAVLTGLLTVWTTLAVGIVGEPDNPLNLVYFAVLSAAIAGGAAAWGQPAALARAMFAVAALQGLTLLVHVVDHIPAAPLIDGFFAVTWFVAGLLFMRASRQLRVDADRA